MEWFEIELDGRRTTTFRELPVAWFADDDADNNEGSVEQEEEPRASLMGGISFGGNWGWLTRRYASDATLIISCLQTGYTIARHVFWSAHHHNDHGDNNHSTCTSIRCVEELYTDHSIPVAKQQNILAICLETWTRGDRMNTVKTHLVIYSIKWNQVLRRIHLDGILASTLTSLSPELCGRTQHFHNFDGCLAIGSDDGTILIMDLEFQNVLRKQQSNYIATAPNVGIQRIPSYILSHRAAYYIKGSKNDNHWAVDINVANSGIRCLVVIDIINGFAAGLENGEIILYDLKGLKVLTILRTTDDLGHLSVERICCIVPPDDPKPCFYLSAMYQSEEKILALLHVISFRRSTIQVEEFQSSHTCARLLLDGPFCTAIDCSTASTAAIVGDNGTLLVVLSWYSEPEEKNKLILFDINQWYKDEMPYLIRTRDNPNCLAAFVLTERHHMGFALQLKPSSILHFESLNRFDAHFYPNSLTFDCSLLNVKGYRYYAHDGIQSRFINCLRQQTASLFLNPQHYHDDIIRLCLMPLFSELSPNATYSRSAMYEEILSVALENKCLALLYDCALSWLDDSFLCNKVNPTELTLATLTNWIVKRANCIKKHCLGLCQGIFDYNGYSLDEREREEFEVLSSQLKNLWKLQTYIINKGKGLLGESVLDEYEANAAALQLFYNYQWLLYWFMRRGLIPEGNLMQHTTESTKKTQLMQLQREYDERRIQRKKGNLPPLYIDTLLQRNGLANFMNDKQSYPPATMQALMQMMLSTDARLEQKHEVVLYLLMDLERINPGIVVELHETPLTLSQKFHHFFNLREEVIKSVKSFWHLDRGDYWQAVDGLYGGLCKVPQYEDWQMKSLIENLLTANATRLAMRLVARPPGPVSFSLYLRVLLANDRISEAFHYARLYDDDKGRPLLEHFFRHFIKLGKFKVLAELSLREDEEQIVYRLLREFKTRKTDSVHLILLLQRFKYLEAVSFMDEIAVEREQAANEMPNNILSAFRSTMAPVTQSLAGTYFQIRNRLDGRDMAANQSPDPFSSQLVKQGASSDMVGGIFQSSALSTHWATTNYEPRQELALNCQNMPFLRNSHQHQGHILGGRGNSIQHRRQIVRPVPYQPVSKRQRDRQDQEITAKPASYTLQPRKRRRLLGEQLISDLQEFVNRRKFGNQAENTNQGSIYEQLNVEPRGIFKRYPIASSSSAKASQQALNRTERSQESVKQSSNVTENVQSPGKGFFFPPPIPLDEAEAAVVTTTTTEQTDEDETDEIIMEIQSRGGVQHHVSNESETKKTSTKDFYFAPPIPLDPPIVRVVEEETETEMEQEEEEEHDEIFVQFQSRGEPQQTLAVGQANSESDESDEEFLSPLNSANVSLVQETEPLAMAPPTGPQPRHPLLHGRTESSSGFGSFSATSMRLAHTASSRDFVPTVCSSKMGETTNYIKISERTTICGEMPEITEQSQFLMPSSATTTTLGWSLPTRAGQLQDMLDTTLGMSSYDITSMEQRQDEQEEEEEEEEEPIEQEEPIEEMELEEEHQPSERDFEEEQEREEQEEEEEEEEEMQSQMMHQYEEEVEEEQQQTIEVADFSYNHPYIIIPPSEEEDEVEAAAVDAATVDPGIPGPPITNEEHLSSPTFSVSSELSDNSLSEEQPLAPNRLQDDPMYSIVVESTGSITTSRSVTHTPTSFLPSDTNVSQNSSPRAAHGAAGSGPGGIGDASPRSLYRANSLETVDDLDTTKGSLDDDDEEQVEDEDDCVIALDGTEVRGYVPRPQQAAGCSSAELFAFKDDDAAALGSVRPNASLSLGATANSDSVVAETINLDTDDEDKNIHNEMATQSDKVYQLYNDQYVDIVQEPDEIQEDDSIFIVSSQPLEEMQEEEMQEEDMQEEEMQEDEMQQEMMHQEMMQQEMMHQEMMQQQEIEEEEMQQEMMQQEEIEEEEIQQEELEGEEIQEEEIEEEEIQEEEIEEEEIQEEEIQEEYNESMTSQQLEQIEEEEGPTADDIGPIVIESVLERIQEEDEEEEDEINKNVSAMHRQIFESEDPPFKLAFSEDENEPTSFPPTPTRTLRSHDSPRVATPTVDEGVGVGLRRLRRRLHSDDVSTISPNLPQSPSSNRLTRATSTPPSSSTSGSTTGRRLRRLSSQKHPLDAIDEHNNSRDFIQSPGPLTRSRSRLSLDAEPAPTPPQTAASTSSRTGKRSLSTALRPVIPPSSAAEAPAEAAAPTYRRKLRSSSEPPASIEVASANAKTLTKSNRNKRRPSSTEVPSEDATPGTSAELGDQASTSRLRMRMLRARKSESERAPTPTNAATTEEINVNPASEDPPVENNEASVPPKKRGRPRNKIP